MFLLVQLTWIAIQKWQFNHFAHYAARVWSVHKDDTPQEALIKVQIAAIARWDLLNRDYVKFMWVSSESTKDYEDPDRSASGVYYTGFTQLLSIYRNQIGETAFSNPIPSELMALLPIEIPTTGLVRFETFAPMEKEAEEDPDRWDNDCDDTPCGSGNGR